MAVKILIFGGGGMAAGIAKANPGKVVVLTEQDCDVRDWLSVELTIKKYQPKVIINCAGVSNPSPIDESNGNQWRQEIEVNLIGSYNIARSACQLDPIMIFIASVAGKYGKPNHSGYSASKTGVISLVQSLGMEGYKAYAISPGRVDTPMREKDYPDDLPGTRLDVSEIAALVADVIKGKYEPGDNIIIRRIGFETVPIRVDKGEPWKSDLKVGQPKTL